MSSKRVMKKEIRRICGNLAGECILANATIPGADSKKWNDIIIQIAELQENALKHLSTGFDRDKLTFDSGREYRAARSAYYQKAYADLKTQFNEKVEAIVKEMNALLPAAQKEANKAAAK